MSTVRSQARWKLDPAASSAEFRVPHFWGLVKVKGRFESIEGWLETDENGPRQLELVIDAATVTTGNRRRDDHLRSADFFDAERHPQVSFHSSTVSETGDGRLRVEGELVAAGHRVPLELEPTIVQSGDEMQIDASTTVDQRQLGMTWSPLGVTRTPTTLTVHAQLRKEH